MTIDSEAAPLIRFNYRIDGENTDPEGYAGGYALVEGYSGSNRVHKLMYSAGKIWVNNWGARNLNKDVPYHHFALLDDPDTWHHVNLNIARDFERTTPDKTYGKLKADRLVVTLGVWNINDGDEQPFGIYFTGFELDLNQTEGRVILEEKPLVKRMWRISGGATNCGPIKIWPANTVISSPHKSPPYN